MFFSLLESRIPEPIFISSDWGPSDLVRLKYRPFDGESALEFVLVFSVRDPDWIRIQMGSVDPDAIWESEFRQAKTVPRKEKRKKFHVSSVGAGGFSLILNVLCRGLRRHI